MDLVKKWKNFHFFFRQNRPGKCVSRHFCLTPCFYSLEKLVFFLEYRQTHFSGLFFQKEKG